MQILLDQIQKDALIRVYAENNLVILESQPSLIKIIFGGIPEINSFSDIEKTVSGYKEFISLIRKIKTDLEEITMDIKIGAQIRYCLIQLGNVMKQPDAKERCYIFNKIVDILFLQQVWSSSPDLIKQYNTTAEIIQKWNHFFVSYTTRGAPAINNLYHPELSGQFTTATVQKEIDGNNLIAKFIVRCFKDYNNLKVFFDRDSIVCGDRIREEVYEYCEKTFAFIQLIEDVTFNESEGIINWCYKEYEHFEFNNHNNQKKKYFFIIDGLNIDPSKVPPTFFEWAEDIITCSYQKIIKPFDVISVKDKCKEFADLIKEQRVNQINALIMGVV